MTKKLFCGCVCLLGAVLLSSCVTGTAGGGRGGGVDDPDDSDLPDGSDSLDGSDSGGDTDTDTDTDARDSDSGDTETEDSDDSDPVDTETADTGGSDCTEATATSLGNGTTIVTVQSDGCAMIDLATQAPHITGGNVTMQIVVTGTCEECPLTVNYHSSCGTAGSATFTDQYNPTASIPATTGCPVLLDFQGVGLAIALKYW